MRFTVQAPGRATAVRFSSTVSERKMLRSCGVQPTPRRARACGGSWAMSSPPSQMRPPKRVVTPISVSISVVLPTPLRPSSASDRPFSRAKLEFLDDLGLAVAGA